MSNKPLRDISTDTGRQLFTKLAHKYPFPQYVLSVSLEDVKSEGNRSKCAQLLPEPSLPTHTKAATWLSYACFVEQRNELPEEQRVKIASFLEERARFWGIQDDVNEIERIESQLVKSANEAVEAFPVRNEEEAIAADRWLNHRLAHNIESMSTEERIDLANKIATFITPSPLVRVATCKVGCFEGKKVAAKLRDFNKQRKIAEVEQLAKMAEDYSPSEMQDAHAVAAVILSRVTDIACPEIFLKVSTEEPVVFLSNGAVVKQSAVKTSDSPILEVARNVNTKFAMINSATNNVRAAEQMSEDVAYMFCDDLAKAGIAFEVKPRVQTREVLMTPTGD